ncbi:MAG: inverse autotransporter beta domain-containing protein, partial [Deltaproteobacteria bacterium]|nr:inverse autotransporter beta domain-containing protein [Deltaproteobacteria bacterium]
MRLTPSFAFSRPPLTRLTKYKTFFNPLIALSLTLALAFGACSSSETPKGANQKPLSLTAALFPETEELRPQPKIRPNSLTRAKMADQGSSFSLRANLTANNGSLVDNTAKVHNSAVLSGNLAAANSPLGSRKAGIFAPNTAETPKNPLKALTSPLLAHQNPLKAPNSPNPQPLVGAVLPEGQNFQPLSQNPVNASNLYAVTALGSLVAGEASDLTLRLTYKGATLDRKISLKIKPHPALVNLRPILRETDAFGRLKIKGLIVKVGYRSVPLTLDLGPGAREATVLVPVAASPFNLSLTSLSKRLPKNAAATDLASQYDLTIKVAKGGAAYRGSLTFKPHPNLPNLKSHPRTTDHNGQIHLKGLVVTGPATFTAQIDRGPLVSLNWPPENAAVSQTLKESPQTIEASFVLPRLANPKPGQSLTIGSLVSHYLRPDSQGGLDLATKMGVYGVNRLSEVISQKLSPYGQFRSRATLSGQGEFLGGVDYLYPFIDRTNWLLFGQGSLTLNDQGRILASLGAGQRFFPDPSFAFGYNVFLDGDLKRDHFRTGLGFEYWTKNLKLAANLYQAVGPWRPSPDYPRLPVWEKAASGWDLRVEARPSFAQSIALTGTLEKWRGPQIGSFELGRNSPNLLYSYGLKWTPWPLLTLSLSQTKGGQRKTQTNFGLSFNYRPGLTPDDYAIAFSPLAYRHDFVDRDYSLPLAYRAKLTRQIVLVSQEGPGLYRFKVLDGFGREQSSLEVATTVASATVLILDPLTEKARTRFLTDEAGEFVVLYRSPSGESTLTTHVVAHGRGDFKVIPA